MAPRAEAASPGAASYSSVLAPTVRGAPQRGTIHSTFAAAANLLFPNDVVISLNAADTSIATQMPQSCHAERSEASLSADMQMLSAAKHDTTASIVDAIHCAPTLFPALPNGVQVESFPFDALRAGMPALLGADRLVIDAVNCSLDLSCCSQWNAAIERPATLDVNVVQKNAALLAHAGFGDARDGRGDAGEGRAMASIAPTLTCIASAFCTLAGAGALARSLCGRGSGLTPSGDDILLGWMAANWLLHGPCPPVFMACHEVLAVARQRTHLLSVCWLGYAARGYVALPIKALLAAMTRDDEQELTTAAQLVAAIGATSGLDVIRGIVLGSSCALR